MIFNSIRWRLQAWHGIILVAVLAGFGLTAYQVSSDNQLRRIDRELEQQWMFAFRPEPPERLPDRRPGIRGQEPGQAPPAAGHSGPPEFRFRIRPAIQDTGSEDGSQTNENSYYYMVWRKDGSVAARSAEAPAEVPFPKRIPSSAETALPSGRPDQALRPPPGARMQFTARTRGELREFFRITPRGDCALAGRSISIDLAAMHRLAAWLVAAGFGVLGLGLAGGWWVTSRAIRPIEDISATALKISAGDLSQRINAGDTGSELGRLVQVLNSTFSRLEAAFSHQSRFTSDASHELRTPVAVILSQTQTALSRERVGPEYREALEACQRAAQRMRKLTESLLELARLDAGQASFNRDAFDLAHLARECVELVRPLAKDRGVQVHCDLPSLECSGDAGRISQVITNFLTNAIQFNSSGGDVRISGTSDQDSAYLRVADTGVGIASEDLPHIFERFYRADKSRVGGHGHTGLGLAICKSIVEAHGGTIEVASQLGSGSTFTVKLPLG